MRNIILQQVNYNLWANKRFADLLVTIAPSLLDAEIKSSFASIRKTVHHIWDAELIWLSRLHETVLSWPPSAQFKNPVINQFIETSGDYVRLVSNKDENYFNAVIVYKNIKGEEFKESRANMILHCMNHSTFHRGQLVTMLRQSGITELPQTDLIAYLRLIKS